MNSREAASVSCPAASDAFCSTTEQPAVVVASTKIAAAPRILRCFVYPMTNNFNE